MTSDVRTVGNSIQRNGQTSIRLSCVNRITGKESELFDCNQIGFWSYLISAHGQPLMCQTVVTICTVQWSIYVSHSGHYMYCTVVTICTVQWSLYVPYCGNYMYRTVVTKCTAQWSLYVPYSGHYMYHTVVTVCTVQWSLYVPPV